MVTEIKLDDYFPVSQFNVKVFSTPSRFDRNKNGGGITFYILGNVITEN